MSQDRGESTDGSLEITEYFANDTVSMRRINPRSPGCSLLRGLAPHPTAAAGRPRRRHLRPRRRHRRPGRARLGRRPPAAGGARRARRAGRDRRLSRRPGAGDAVRLARRPWSGQPGRPGQRAGRRPCGVRRLAWPGARPAGPAAGRARRPAARRDAAPDRASPRRKPPAGRGWDRGSTSACARSIASPPAAQGQRLGLFSGSGIGKSTLLAMLARHTAMRRGGAGPGRRARARGAGVPRGRSGRRRAWRARSWWWPPRTRRRCCAARRPMRR